MEYLLSGEDVKKVAGRGAIVLNYPELYQYNSLEELFSNGITKVIILYLTDRDDVNMMLTGHWISLTVRDNHVVFFDSYGYMPDSEIKFNKSVEKRKFLNQNSNYLTGLLYNFCKQGGIVEYNQLRLQKTNKNVNTCGRWASFQARFSLVPLDTFQDLFKEVREKGYNLDDVIVELTNNLL